MLSLYSCLAMFCSYILLSIVTYMILSMNAIKIEVEYRVHWYY